MKRLLISLFVIFSSFNSFACEDENKKFLDQLLDVTGDAFYYKKDTICERLKKVAPKVYKKINLEEVLAIHSYTTDGSNRFYTHYNRTLRRPKKGDKAKYGKAINVIKKGLKKFPNYVGNVIRWEKKKSINSWTVGKIKTFKGFTSTSKKKNFTWSGNVKMVIKSKTGKFIGMISAYQSEQEVLFAPGKKFRVTKRQKASSKTNNKHLIWLEEVVTP